MNFFLLTWKCDFVFKLEKWTNSWCTMPNYYSQCKAEFIFFPMIIKTVHYLYCNYAFCHWFMKYIKVKCMKQKQIITFRMFVYANFCRNATQNKIDFYPRTIICPYIVQSIARQGLFESNFIRYWLEVLHDFSNLNI